LAAPKRKRSLPLFTPEYQLGLSIFTRNVFRELFGRFKPPFVVVFDNYQEVPLNSTLHEVTRDAVGEVPEGGRLIFISRSEAPAAFAPVQVKQAMEILPWEEVKFTRSEINELVKSITARRSSAGVVDHLHEATDGWAAGLVLLLERLQKDGEMTIESSGKSSQVLFDYFAGEIFKRTTPEAREILLHTSFLSVVTAKMAQDLTRNPAAGDVLGNLHKENYFTNKRSGVEATYEFHPLFRDFLLTEAHRTYSREQRKQISVRAGNLAHAAGRIEEAAELYRDAEDWEELTKLICEHAPLFLSQGRIKVVEEWIGVMPRTIVDQKSWLLYWRGVSLNGWRHHESEQSLRKAFTLFEQQGNAAGALLSLSMLMMAYQGEGRTLAMEPYVEPIERVLARTQVFPSVEVEMRVAQAMLAICVYRRPNHPDGDYWAERAFELVKSHSDPGYGAINHYNRVLYYWQLGDLSRASIVVEEMKAFMRRSDIPPAIALLAGMSVSLYDVERAEPSCRQKVSEILQMAGEAGIFFAARYVVLYYGIIAALGDGDLKTARPWISEMEQGLPYLGPGYRSWYLMAAIRLALLENEVDRAASYQPEMLQVSLAAGWHFNDALAYILSAIVLHARHAETEARQHLARAFEIAEMMRSPYVEFMARNIEAHIGFDIGEDEKALASLRTAMELSRKGGFLGPFLWQPNIMAKLCVKALEYGIEVDYVKTLIRKRHLVPEEAPVAIEDWPWPVKIYALGQFLVMKDDQPLSFSHKVQKKPLALLKAIIAFGGKNVREDLLLDALWPDSDGDTAGFALTSAIHRLRKLLGHEQAI
ncbi:MAG TPA: hypothetical protein VE131_10350, partial [Terriglobales bacterium]|nr:hypothetical protein [Terriglobales bacterium]